LNIAARILVVSRSRNESMVIQTKNVECYSF
jgi:hypothetical protein